MARYIIIFLSILLAVSEFNFGNPGGVTVWGRAAGSLSYAFSPLLLALVLSGVKRLFQKMRGTPSTFSSDVTWMWGILLVLLALAHAADVMKP